MDPRTIRIFSVAITTFIPWLISVAALGAITMLPYAIFVPVHYALVVLLFGVGFGFYFHGHKGVDPFTVMGIAVLSIFLFDSIYFGFLYEGELWFLTYADYFLPLFLISSTIYWVGKFLK